MLGNYDLAAATTTKSGFNPSTILIILVVVVAFYFLMIRPQQRRKQQAAQQQNTVEPGARVRTTAGMYATVVDVDGDDVILEVAPGVEVRYMKRAIMEVISSADVTEDTAFGADSDADADADDADDADTATDAQANTDEAHTDADWESFASDGDAAEAGRAKGGTTASSTKD